VLPGCGAGKPGKLSRAKRCCESKTNKPTGLGTARGKPNFSSCLGFLVNEVGANVKGGRLECPNVEVAMGLQNRWAHVTGRKLDSK